MAPGPAGECGRGCRRGKAAHAGAGAVVGFFGCLMLVSLLSSSKREWIGKSEMISDGYPVEIMSYSTMDKYGESNHVPVQLEKFLQNVIQQDIETPTVQYNMHECDLCAGTIGLNVDQNNALSSKHTMMFYLFASVGLVVISIVITICNRRTHSNKRSEHEKLLLASSAKISRKWSKRALLIGVLFGLFSSVWIFSSMHADVVARRIENLANMCDERARMLQDQFNVSMNHVHALAILVSTFHHGKNPSAIDQKTFEDFTARTIFERPLMSGVAYALKVLHREREIFEHQHGWKIKKMEAEDQSLVHDYNPEKLEPSPVQDEYAPVIFSQETVKHIISVDMMSGKEDHDNILRSRATDATPEERIDSTLGYLGASFDVPSLVERLLEQLASKQKIVVKLYDTTNYTCPLKMYDSDVTASGDLHISTIDFGDPTRKHEMHCRFKHEPQLPWSAIVISLAVAVIVLLVGYIIHVTLNSLEKAEYNYGEMRKLKVQAEAADVAKSQFLATVSHEIRTPMTGVLGMLQMLMDTELDTTQQDFVVIAEESGKALINIINEVLDLAKIESGRFELEAVPFDVRDILDNVVSLFSEKSQSKGIELAVFVSDQVPDVLIGDPWRFRQIITNLVGNSMKRLGIQCDRATTSESALSALLEACKSSSKSKHNMVLVDKEAWGEGSGLEFFRRLENLRLKGTLMSGQTMPNLFLLASSIGPADSDCLSLVGNVDSIRKPLRLSTVTACLRKALGVGVTRLQIRDQSLVTRSVLMGKHILVVDDTAVNRVVAAGVLKKYGAKVTSVDSGKEAMSLLQPPHEFDACFMDVQMPEMDGFEATRLVRIAESKINGLIEAGEVSAEIYGNKVHWHVPILAMTADVIQATCEECTQCGMDGYVSKPFDEQQLYSAVAHFV